MGDDAGTTMATAGVEGASAISSERNLPSLWSLRANACKWQVLQCRYESCLALSRRLALSLPQTGQVQRPMISAATGQIFGAAAAAATASATASAKPSVIEIMNSTERDAMRSSGIGTHCATDWVARLCASPAIS